MGVSESERLARLAKDLAGQCGFELAGIAPAEPLAEAAWYQEWVRRGFAGAMSYLVGRRAEVRLDPRLLLSTARSIVCLGRLYNGPEPYSTGYSEPGHGWISRYAWGEDYHQVIHGGLRRLAAGLRDALGRPFDWKACVDTAPLLERAYARRAGLGWIGKNSCLINQQGGSWYFLAALLVSLEMQPDSPPADRCGSCTRCIDACPTRAIVPARYEGGPSFTVDSRRCISYLTIELRGEIPSELQPAVGRNIFGCDICQDVCPWNRKAPVTADPALSAVHFAPPLDDLTALSADRFREMFARSSINRAGYRGLQRNVTIARGNSGL
ncbi:MAG: tRNA epoxyqueuosine(34) reductase QueG [Bryobacteraceae bacterium]